MDAIVRRRLVRLRNEPQARTPRWILPLLGAFAALAVLGSASIGAVFLTYNSLTSGYVPIREKISSRYAGLTEVYDRGGPDGGVFLGTISNPNAQLLEPVSLDQISHWMTEATISTEDNSFWENPGVDPKGLLRAAVENYRGGGVGSGGGGSSITQQLVKNVYLTDKCSNINGQRVCVAPRTLDRKLKEVAYAFELEKEVSKSEILNLYFNQVSYADRYVGVEAAAQGYFRTSAADLTLAQASLLAGIPAAPTAYHPRINCVKDDDGRCVTDAEGRTQVGGEAKERQKHVLDLMVDHGRATREEADAAFAEPLLVYPATNPMQAAAWIDNQVEPRLVRMCEAGLLPMIPGAQDCIESVHSAGYKVTTTLDWAKTQEAMATMNQAIVAGLAAGCNCHNAAIATIEPTTGQIVVYAPNIDPTWVSDPRVAGNIDQLVEINQPGSSFKPAVYLGYMDKLQKVPLSSIWDTSPLVFTDPGSRSQVSIVNPRQVGTSEGLITVRAALGGSQNVGAFRAAYELGNDSVIAYAKALGLTTLEQQFDPTFRSHSSIYYGPSIATGGANVRAIDMAYMNSVFANMGYMVGVPTLARTVELADMKSTADARTEAERETAYAQAIDFQRGNIRLPGTRKLDPVTVLKVQSIDGTTLYEHGSDLQKVAVVDPESVWLLQSIMTDCTARFIIWSCGSSNSDLSLDPFMDGVKIPTGVKTGTQQGFRSADDTLATWMNGFTRYAATAVWVGNADKSLVRDGRAGGYASANATVRLFKTWMGQYHHDLKAAGVFETPANFDDLRPQDVAWAPYQTATTERGQRGGCSQMIPGWVRTDVHYTGDCQGKGFMPLPTLRPDLALAIAVARGIPTNGYAGRPAGSPTAELTPAVAVTPAPVPAVRPAPAVAATPAAVVAATPPPPATPPPTTTPVPTAPVATPASTRAAAPPPAAPSAAPGGPGPRGGARGR